MKATRYLAALLVLPMLAWGSETSVFSAIAGETGGASAFSTLADDAVADAADEIAETDTDTRTVLAELPDRESRLTLGEAIRLALRNNLDIELARTAPEIAETAIQQAKGAFDPVGQASYGFAHGETPTSITLQNADSQEGDNWDYGFGISGILPFGLQYSTGTSVNRTETDQSIQLLDRRFESRFDNQLTLPLMRDFRTNLASVNVRRSEITRDMTEEEFRSQLTLIVAGIEDLYWALSAARAGVNVAQKSLKTVEDLLEQTKVQEEVGVVSRVAVIQAEAGVAERELNLIRAENTAQAAHDALLDAVLAPSAAVFEDREIIPEAPRFREYAFDLDVAVKRALTNRPELEISKKQIEMAKLETKFAENQAKPRLDLVGSYGFAGQSGRVRDSNVSANGTLITFVPGVDTPIDTGRPAPPNTSAVDSFDEFFDADGERSFSLGFRVEMPFGNNTGEGREVQRRIEERRARVLMRRQEQAIIREVRDAARMITNAAKSVRAAERRRIASAESLRAEQERLRLGDSTPFQVLEFESDLADAEGTVIQALRVYENAITALERVQGTLLDSRDIRIDDELSR